MIIEDTGTQEWVTHNGLFGEHVRGLPERMEKAKVWRGSVKQRPLEVAGLLLS